MTAIVPAQEAPTPERISLWENHAPVGDGSFQTADAFITVYRPAHPNGAAVIICPGGGYGVLMVEPEGKGIARWLNQHGITGIVLEYRLPHGQSFLPLLDAQRAIRVARSRTAEWKLDPAKIGIMGFSAGGHVASTAGTHFDWDCEKKVVSTDSVSSRPDFMVLIYPVIRMGETAHRGSRTNLLGPLPSVEMIALFSNEQQVTEKTPPAYLAHAKDDVVVSPVDSRILGLFRKRMSRRGSKSQGRAAGVSDPGYRRIPALRAERGKPSTTDGSWIYEWIAASRCSSQ